MLIALSIRDIVLIKSLTLTLDNGLTALTGETGAGKSILLDALGLALGGRADKSLVRQGCKEGAAAATFALPKTHPIWESLSDNGLGATPDEETLVLRRVQRADGRSLAFINDEAVSISLLAAAGAALVETHGQNEGQGFLRPAAHRGVLDQFGGLGEAVRKAAAAHEAWRAAAGEREAFEAEREALTREAAYFRQAAEELEALDPQPEEETRLVAERKILMSTEKILADLKQAEDILNADHGLDDRLAGAARRLDAVAAQLKEAEGSALFEVIANAGAALDRALAETADAKDGVARALAAVEPDPNALEAADDRLFALRAAARKYGVAVTALPDVLSAAQSKLETVVAGDREAKALAEAEEAARGAFLALARALSKKRVAAAKRLDAAVKRELKPLKLDKATFLTDVQSHEKHLGAEGLDRVEFQISTNPGAPLGPLAHIASGGELSRFVLALKAALAAKEDKTVIIFDEVDAGVGGAVADAVGERLARLAGEGGQVLVVTHSPQVAARADDHWRIAKTKAETRITQLDAAGREDEIARMLSGAEITVEARAAAAKLLTPPASRSQKLKKSA